MFSIHTTPKKFEIVGFTLKTQQMFSVHTTPEKFQNKGFILKTQQMFFVHTTPEKFENATTTAHVRLMLEEFSEGRVYLQCIYNIEDITRWREDMNFMFEWQEQYLTSQRSERVGYCSCHENIKFISSS